MDIANVIDVRAMKVLSALFFVSFEYRFTDENSEN